MKPSTLAIVALLALSTNLYAAATVDDFVEQTTSRFDHCRSNVQAYVSGIAPDFRPCYANRKEDDLSDLYASVMKTLQKNKSAQTLMKDYYALWLSSMNALMPSGDINKAAWAAQASRLDAELKQKAQRL